MLYIFCWKINTLLQYTMVSVLVLGIGIAGGQCYWVLGGLLGIVLTLSTSTIDQPWHIVDDRLQSVKLCEWSVCGLQVVVIFIICVVGLLFLYMLFLLCLDPLMTRRPVAYTEQHNEQPEEVSMVSRIHLPWIWSWIDTQSLEILFQPRKETTSLCHKASEAMALAL